jgi:hypothetical protein
MPDNQQDSTAPDGLGNANSNSAGQDERNSFDPATAFNSLRGLPEFEQYVQEVASRQAQSVKDKRFAKLETKTDAFAEQLAKFNKLKAGGLSEEVALEFMQLQSDRNSAETDEQQVQQVSKPLAEAQPKAEGIDYGQVLGAMGIPENDARVTEVLREHPNDFVAQMQAFANIAGSQTQAPNTPNPAGVLPTFNARNVSQPDLQAQYQKDREALRQGDVYGLLNLKMQYRQKGLDIM